MSTARERFIAGNALPREPLTVTLPDGPLALEIRGVSAETRGRIYNDCMRTVAAAGGPLHEDDDDDVTDDRPSREVDQAKLGPLLVCECTFDEAGAKVFANAGDLALVAGLNAAGLDEILLVALRLSGMQKDAVKVAAKN